MREWDLTPFDWVANQMVSREPSLGRPNKDFHWRVDMAEAVLEDTRLSPDDPQRWLDNGYEPLLALSWRDVQDVQLEVLKRQFDTFKTSVAALDKLARREGVSSVDSIEDALP